MPASNDLPLATSLFLIDWHGKKKKSKKKQMNKHDTLDYSCLTPLHRCSSLWASEEDASLAGLGGEADAYPYVSFTINII